MIYGSAANEMSANQQPPPGAGPLWTALVERVAGGDPNALQTLCASLAWLKGYFCNRVGPDDAEDMFHAEHLSGVNYFFALTTIISPDQRQLLFDS